MDLQLTRITGLKLIVSFTDFEDGDKNIGSVYASRRFWQRQSLGRTIRIGKSYANHGSRNWDSVKNTTCSRNLREAREDVRRLRENQETN